MVHFYRMDNHSSPTSRSWFAAKLCAMVLALSFQAKLCLAQNPQMLSAAAVATDSSNPLPDDTLPPDPAAATSSSPPATGASAGIPLPAVPQGPPAGSQPLKLFGGVSHSESLPHVDQALSIHRNAIVPLEISRADSATTNGTKQAYLPMNGVAQPINDSARQLSAEVKRYTAEWFMIPPWMAGKWIKPGDLTLSITDLKTGQKRNVQQFVDNRLQASWGHQKDAAGNVWHVNFLPSERDGQSDGKLVRFWTMKQSCEKSDPQMLVTRTQYVVSESEIWTGKALDMFQQESLNHYLLGPNDSLVNLSTNRVFTYDGQPVRDGELRSAYERLADFTPTQLLNDFDLKQSLNEYLESHGLAHLKTP